MAAFGAEVDDVVRRFDHVQIVFDHDDRVPVVDQSVQALQQPVDVGEVQAGRGLIKDVEVVLSALQLSQLRGQFDALGFAAGQNR